MKLNPDCIRDVLIWLEENMDVSDKGFSTYRLCDLYNGLSHYNDDEIYYSVYNLFQIGYIDGRFSLLSKGKVQVCEINNITWEGHQFLNTIRPTSVWEATKSGASKLGIMSMHALSSIAMKVSEAIVTDSAVISKIIEHLQWY